MTEIVKIFTDYYGPIVAPTIKILAPYFGIGTGLAKGGVQLVLRRIGKKRLARIEEGLGKVNSHLLKLQISQNRSAQRFVDLEETTALLEKTVEAFAREVSEQKRTILANTLVRLTFPNKTISFDEKLTILETVDALTKSDLAILSRFNEDLVCRVVDLLPMGANEDFCGKERAFGEILSPTVASLCKLSGRGLISEHHSLEARVFHYSGNRDDWRAVWRRKIFAITPFGQQVRSAISDPVEQPSNKSNPP